MGIILAAKVTCSSSSTRMTRPSCLKLRVMIVACKNARPRRCELASLVAIFCHFVPYQNSGVPWTYKLILGVLETSDYSVCAQYRPRVLYMDTRAALGGAQITIITTTGKHKLASKLVSAAVLAHGSRS